MAAQKDYQETGKWKELHEEKARSKDIIKCDHYVKERETRDKSRGGQQSDRIGHYKHFSFLDDRYWKI